MSKTLILLVVCLGLLLVVSGCDRNVDVTQSNMGSHPLVAKISLPAGATLESATLNVYHIYDDRFPMNVHRVTETWDEMVVTWNSFGGAYDPAIWGTVPMSSAGWNTADITGLVQSWLDETHENFGLLLDQDEVVFPRNKFFSRENVGFDPFVEICYTLGGEIICIMEEVTADTYIYENDPNANFGADIWLFTGWYNDVDLEKQTLLMFDTEPRDQEGCTRTIGFWKTHAGFGPQDDEVTQYLPIWLGDAGGSESREITDAGTAVEIFKKKDFGGSSNGIAKLYAQLLGTKLNIAAGTTPDDVSATIAAADAFLADNDYTDWDSLDGATQAQVLAWKDTLDDYNNGFIGPGHCFDEDEEDEEEDD